MQWKFYIAELYKIKVFITYIIGPEVVVLPDIIVRNVTGVHVRNMTVLRVLVASQKSDFTRPFCKVAIPCMTVICHHYLTSGLINLCWGVQHFRCKRKSC